MNKKWVVFWGCAVGILLAFQNCSPARSFSNKSLNSADGLDQDSTPSGTTVCYALNPSEICDPMPGPGSANPSSRAGLKGKLYYLTPENHNTLFNNDLNNALIDDYENYGILVPVNILMTSINITARSWDSGFVLPTGNQVTTERGEKLFEWFHLDLNGYIELPEGDYQFTTISDDGIRITLDNERIINDEGTHAPRFKCSRSSFHFAKNEKKKLRVQYYQGPRMQIAMELLVRSASKSHLPCNDSGGWNTIGSSSYSY